jgi:hypothetical protein
MGILEEGEQELRIRVSWFGEGVIVEGAKNGKWRGAVPNAAD